MRKRYSHLRRLSTFDERFDYLKVDGRVGDATFGFDRYLNQRLYHSAEWKNARDAVILRDNGCDLGMPGREIMGHIYVHHINPITIEDIEAGSDALFDPENLICVSFDTHNAIHYGDKDLLPRDEIVVRRPNDTCPWKK